MRAAGALILAISTACAGHARAQSVHIQGREVGQGIVRQVGTECFIVSPEHVVANSPTYAIRGEGLARASAELATTFADDLAALRVLPGNLTCAPWTEIAGFSDFIRQLNEGVVHTVNADGSLSKRFVRISDSDGRYIRVRPMSTEDALFQGLSGSAVYGQNKLIGILQSVEADTGGGIVLALPYIEDLTRQFFGGGQQQPSPAPTRAVEHFLPDHPASTDVGPGWKFYNVSAVTTDLPPRLVHDIALAATLNPSAGTSVTLPALALPVGLRFEMPDAKAGVPISGIALKLPEQFDLQSFAKDVDVTVEYAEGNTKKVAAVSLKRVTSYQMVEIEKSAAKTVTLTFKSNWGGNSLVLPTIGFATR